MSEKKKEQRINGSLGEQRGQHGYDSFCAAVETDTFASLLFFLHSDIIIQPAHELQTCTPSTLTPPLHAHAIAAETHLSELL